MIRSIALHVKLGRKLRRVVIITVIVLIQVILYLSSSNVCLSAQTSRLYIQPVPELYKMINSSQTVVTLTAQYRMENPYLCRSVPEIDFLIIVNSACHNFERRMAIRSSWANATIYAEYGVIKILFLLGITSTTEEDLQSKIKIEFEEYGDLLVGDFYDDYHNLTLKGVMALKWITERCRNAKFVLKIDDDIEVNMFKIFQELYPRYVDKRHYIVCNYIPEGVMPVVRDNNSKWFVEEKHFKGLTYYPTSYCSGFFVLITNDLIPYLFESSKITPFFWVDDVYLYGLLPKNLLRVQYIVIPGRWFTLSPYEAIDCYRNVNVTCPFIAMGAYERREVEALWHEIVNRQVLTVSLKQIDKESTEGAVKSKK